MKLRRLSRNYRKNASSLHKAVGGMLLNSPLFAGYRIYQEYPVNKISPRFDSGREKFDWVIMDLMVVIECHGQQHYMPVRFGGITQEEAQQRFQDQLKRDKLKKMAAEGAGWTYVVFRYDEEDISSSALLSKISAAERMAQDRGDVQKDRNLALQEAKRQRQRPRETDRRRTERLEKARKYRREQYRRWKQRKNENRRR